MPVKRRKDLISITLFSIFAILTLDQCTKSLVRLKLPIGESVPLIRNILHITFVANTGGAFGIFKNSTPVFIVISIFAIIFISTLIIGAIRKGQFLTKPAFNAGSILILSGAMGNLIDRLRFGYVVDFIDVRIWPVFNVADSAITIGTFLLILSFISRKNNNQ